MEEQRKSLKSRVAGIGGAASVLFLAACGGGDGSGSWVARAGAYRLSIEDAAALVAPATELPADADVVEALADLWIDYTLLADAASRDSTLTGLDLAVVLDPRFDQEIVLRLREQVVSFDTVVSEEDLREAWDREAPGAEVRARHILFAFPAGGGPAEREGRLREAEATRAELEAGADFATLARERSDDPGSAREGGDLGFFARGQMVPPFDSAAFTLPPGMLSGVVESPFGFHILRVEERRAPDFAEVRDAFRDELIQRRIADAEEAYIAEVEARVGIELAEDAIGIARGIGQSPGVRLTGRRADRPLGSFDGGAFTVGEFQQWIQAQPPALRAQLEAATDDQLRDLVLNLTRGSMLVAEARRQGIEIPAEERSEGTREARELIVGATREIGLAGIVIEPGETREAAVARTVRTRIEGMIRGNQEVIPLGSIGWALREGTEARMDPEGIEAAVIRIQDLRGAAARQGAPAPSGGPAPEEPATPGGSPEDR